MESIYLNIEARPQEDDFPCTGWDTRIYSPKTKELAGGIVSTEVHIKAGKIITATLNIEVGKLDLKNVAVDLEEINFFERITGKKYKLVEA